MLKPELFFACSNVTDNYLTHLGYEMNGILQVLYGFREKGVLGVDHPPINADAQVLFDYLSHYGPATKQLDIFHYSGHAGAHHFLTSGGIYDEDQFIDVLSGLKPRLVFLNGCSTKGFVDRLLAHGVGAIIATSVNVDDRQASEFAIRFYGAFSKKQTLRDAFRKARTVDDQKNDAAAGIMANMVEREEIRLNPKSWGNLPPRDRTAAWGLYYTKDEDDYNETGQKTSILDWQLVNIDRPELALPQQVITLNRAIQDLWQGSARQSIDKSITNAQKLIDKYPEDSDAQQLLNDAQKREQEEILIPIQEKQAELYKILREPGLKARRASAVKEIEELNYLDQLAFLGQKQLGTEDLGALLLQGGHKCALKLLQEIMAREVFLPIGTDSCRMIEVNLSSNVYSCDELFRQMCKQFKGSTTTDEVVAQIEALFSNGINVVVVFNNFAKTIKREQLIILKQFWQQIVRRYKQSKLALLAPVKGRVFMFILDKNCTVTEQNGKLVSDNEAEYQEHFADETGYAYVVPVVQSVSKNTVDVWIQRSFIAFGKNGFAVNDFDPPNFMLDAIRKACNEVEAKVLKETLGLYDNEFARYAYPPPLSEQDSDL